MTINQHVTQKHCQRLIKALLLSGLVMFIGSIWAQVDTSEPLAVKQGADSIGGFVVPAIIQVDMQRLPKPVRWQPGDPVVEIPRRVFQDRNQPSLETEPRGFGFDPLAIQQNGDAIRGGNGIESTIINQPGAAFNGMVAADPVGDVGIDFYVQVVSANGPGSDVLIINKNTGAQAASFSTSSLAMGSGTGCIENTINPLVIFDQSAAGGEGRWLLSEITDNSICMYISQTTDPTAGSWFVYEFLAVSNGLPDYFKVVAWPDAYYGSANELFENNRPGYAFDRINMLLGNPARPFQAFSYPTLTGFPFQLLQAADFDGDLAPPAGAPGILLRHNDDESHDPDCPVASQDCIELWEYTVDFDIPANSTFMGPQQITISEFDSNLCGLTSFACVSQADSAVLLDPVREPVMWRAQYRNLGDSQQVVGSFVTDVDGNDRHGVRWFILQRPPGVASGGWSLQQEGTFSPDATNRWMSSAATDFLGNLVVGFNVSGSTTGVFPGIRYAGRLSTDTAGQLPQGEFSVIEGTSPNATNRYGAYSALVVDPVDDCTFWYTSQYNPGVNWQTQIASFQFNSCGTPGFALGGTPLNQQVCSPGDLQDITVNVASIGGFTNPVTLALGSAPAGTTASFSPNPVVPGNSSLAQISLAASVSPGMASVLIDATAAGGMPDTLGINLEVFNGTPLAPQLQVPANTAVDVDLPVLLSWSASAQSSGFFIELATDGAFSNIIYTANESATSHLVNTELDSLTTYFWRVSANNPCGIGAASAIFSFTTRQIAQVLLVDDDDNDPDTRAFYTSALNNLAIDFEVFDTNNSDNEPSTLELSGHDAVIWFTGGEFGGAAGPGGAGEVALSGFLNDGGCLLVSSQDYLLDRGPPPTPFMADFLGLGGASASDDGDYVTVSGAPGSMYDGLGPYILDYVSAGLSDVSDDMVPDSGAQLTMVGNNVNGAGVGRVNLNTLYLGFPLEALGQADREQLMQTFFDQCMGLTFETFFRDGFESR